MDLYLEGLEEFLEVGMIKRKIPGLGIGIIKDGSILYNKGFGYADIENEKCITTDTVFRFGSISKTLTAIGIMQLVEQGKISLDDDINQYLPKGRIYHKNKDATPITFKHLLIHTSGIGEILKKSDLLNIPHYANKNPKKIHSHEKIFSRNIKLKNSPGTKWSYANFGYMLLGYLIEIITGVEFSEYIIQNILDPLEMKNSDFAWSDRVKPLQAKGYKAKKDGFVESGTTMQAQMPEGSLYASINDMMKYMQCLLNGGKTNGAEILKKETLEDMMTTQFQLDERLKSIGYCFWLYDIFGIKVVNHGGSITGYLAEMYLLPEENVGIIIAINQNSMRDMSAIRIAHSTLHRLLKVKGYREEIKKVKATTPTSLLKKFQGRYGPGPPKNVLTNTRHYMSGGEIKIRYKNGDLLYTTMWGGKGKGAKLWQVNSNDPLFYRIVDKLGYSTVEPFEDVLFKQKPNGEVESMLRGFNEFVKKPWYRTFKFKFYSRFTLLIISVVFLINILQIFAGMLP